MPATARGSGGQGSGFGGDFLVAVELDHDVGDFDQIAGLDKDFHNGSGIGGRDFNRCFIRFNFKDDIAFLDGISHFNANGNDFTFVDSFTQIGQPERSGHAFTSHAMIGRLINVLD